MLIGDEVRRLVTLLLGEMNPASIDEYGNVTKRPTSLHRGTCASRNPVHDAPVVLMDGCSVARLRGGAPVSCAVTAMMIIGRNRAVTAGRMPVHPIDEALQLLGENSSPEQRLEVVWAAYESATGQGLGRPPADSDRLTVRRWLRDLRGTGSAPILMTPARTLRVAVAGSLPEKASLLAQTTCPACEVLVTDEGKFPLFINFPIQVDPWAAQSFPRKTQLREAVKRELGGGRFNSPWPGPLCVTIVAVVARGSRRKDVDNLAKGLLDSMEGVVYSNDRQVQCLSSRRVEYAGVVGYYLVRVRAVRLWTDDVVFDDPTSPVIGSGARVQWPTSGA